MNAIAVDGANPQWMGTDRGGAYLFSAEGGQALSDGTTVDGKKVHTGVYLVFASNETGGDKVVTKILVIN